MSVPGALARREDWRERMADAVLRATTVPFQRGRHDCITVAADIVTAMCGADPIADLRGRTTTGDRRWRCCDGSAE